MADAQLKRNMPPGLNEGLQISFAQLWLVGILCTSQGANCVVSLPWLLVTVITRKSNPDET